MKTFCSLVLFLVMIPLVSCLGDRDDLKEAQTFLKDADPRAAHAILNAFRRDGLITDFEAGQFDQRIRDLAFLLPANDFWTLLYREMLASARLNVHDLCMKLGLDTTEANKTRLFQDSSYTLAVDLFDHLCKLRDKQKNASEDVKIELYERSPKISATLKALGEHQGLKRP